MIVQRDGQVAIEITGLEPLLRITSVNLGPILRDALLAVGKEVEAEVKPAPGPVEYPLAWTNKMRRAYFAKRRMAGPFQKGRSRDMYMGPWKRETDPQSERVMASWTVEAEADNKVVVSNSASYAPWVHSQEKQAIMHHVTGWKTDVEAIVAVEQSGAIERIVGQAIGHALEVD